MGCKLLACPERPCNNRWHDKPAATSCDLAAATAPPLAQDDMLPQSPGGPTTTPGPGVLTNDTVPCGSNAKLTVTSSPQHGTVALSNSGALVYTPSQPGQRIDDSFEYTVTCDGMQSTATVSLPGDRGLAPRVFATLGNKDTSLSPRSETWAACCVNECSARQ